MRRAFWITLLAGYIGGLLAAAFYLPRAILAPSLANLLMLTLVSTAVITVVAWRTVSNEDIDWRLVWRRMAGNLGLGSVGFGGLGFEGAQAAVAGGPAMMPVHVKPAARRPASQRDLQPASPLKPTAPRLADDWTPAGVAAPPKAPAVEPTPASAVRRSPASDSPSLLLEAVPLVQLPQRRAAGYRIRSALRDVAAEPVDRPALVRNGLGVESLVRFDRRTLERLAETIERGDLSLAGASMLIEIGQETLRSRKSRRVIDRLSGSASARGFNLGFIIDAAADAPLPRLRADLLGPRVELLLQATAWLDVQGMGIDPKALIESGFAGIALDYEDLLPFLSLPVESDPVFARLNAIEELGGRVLLERFEAESCLRDVFDYPCHWGTGSIFGEVLPVWPAAAPATEALAADDGALAAQQLLGRLGYGAPA